MLGEDIGLDEHYRRLAFHRKFRSDRMFNRAISARGHFRPVQPVLLAG
jgi:hypothetical protein